MAPQNEDSIFLRHRHGSPLLIKPDIKSKVSDLLQQLRENDDHNAVFRAAINDIQDGNGRGIHPESTWANATKELFERFERYYGRPISQAVKDALLGLLELLVEGDDDARFDWDKVRQHLIDNLETLSPLTDRSFVTGGSEVWRGEDGKYYYEDEEMGVVEITGLKTPAEEAIQFYTNDIQMKYGRLYYVLRYIALFDIAYEYIYSRNDFPDSLGCALFDNDGSTNYLDWQWQIPIPFDYVPFQWYPRSPYSNPDWLGSDLVMRLPYPNTQPRESVLPNPPTNEMVEKWKEAFFGYKWQVEVPLASNILMGEGVEEYFDFMDRKVRVVNGNAFIQPLVIVPANEDGVDDGIEIARKFLSALNLKHNIALSEQLISVQQIRLQPWFRQTRMSIFEQIDPQYALPHDDFTQYSDKKWYALALMREAIASNSIYYAFLNYYKVIELISGDVKTWINSNIERVCQEASYDWYQTHVTDGDIDDPGHYLHKTERVAIAHAEYGYQGQGGNIHNPDNPADWRRTQEDLPVIRALAKDIIKGLS